MAKMERAALEAALRHFTGTENYTRASGLYRRLVMTDGVKFLADNAEAHWLLDVIASHLMTNKRLQREEFQTWTLKRRGDDDVVPENQPHTVEATDGNDGPPIVRQELTYTDFPLPEAKLFVAISEIASERVWVVMLPGEY